MGKPCISPSQVITITFGGLGSIRVVWAGALIPTGERSQSICRRCDGGWSGGGPCFSLGFRKNLQVSQFPNSFSCYFEACWLTRQLHFSLPNTHRLARIDPQMCFTCWKVCLLAWKLSTFLQYHWDDCLPTWNMWFPCGDIPRRFQPLMRVNACFMSVQHPDASNVSEGIPLRL